MAKSFNKNLRGFLKRWCFTAYGFLNRALTFYELPNTPPAKPLSEMTVRELSDWSMELANRLITVVEQCAVMLLQHHPEWEKSLPYRDEAVHLAECLRCGRIK